MWLSWGRRKLSKIRRDDGGQALVEFALIIVLLLFVLFLIIESGRLFQGWLTVQNSARAAGRYALTGQFDPSCLSATPFPCLDPRIFSIKEEARRTATGLNIDSDVPVGEPKSFVTEVWSPNAEGNWVPDYAGTGGSPIRVRVTFQMPLITPLLQSLVPSVRLVGQIVVTAENSDQTADAAFQRVSGDTSAPGGNYTLPNADLALDKSAPGTSQGVTVGSDFTYQLAITNYGPFNAEGATIVDTLPPGVTFDGATSPRGSFCNAPVGQELTCFLAPLTGDGGPLSTDRLTVNVSAPTTVGPIVNTATAVPGPSVTDPNLANNTDSVTVNVRVPEADLLVDLRDYYTAVRISDLVTVTVHVENVGPDLAPSVAVTTTLTGDWDGALPLTNDRGCPVSGSVVTCAVGDLASGQSYDVVLTFYANDDPGFIGLSSQVGGLITDPNLTNNGDTAQIEVAAEVVDLLIRKLPDPNPIYVGDTLRYTVQVERDPRADPVGEVVITDTLPAEVSYVEPAVVFNATTGKARSDASCNLVNGDLVCTWPSMAPGEIDQVFVDTIANVAGVTRNEARVGSVTIDQNLANNFSAASKLVGTGDLVVTKTLLTAEPVATLPFTYVLEVHNNGPGTMDYKLVDDLPAGMIVSPDHAPQPTPDCQIFGGVQDGWCNRSLDPGESETFTVTVRTDTPGTYVNRAIVTAAASTPDGDPSNNESELPTTVAAAVDLFVAKSGAPNPVTAGSFLTYTLDVVNLGPATSSAITVTDELTSGLSFVNSVPAAPCSAAGQVVTCVVNNLGPSRRQILELVVAVDSGYPEGSTISNTVSVEPAELELNEANNSDGVLINVARTVDLSLTKQAAQNPVAAGDTLIYQMSVHNSGPSDASNVVVTDTLPLEVVYDPDASFNLCTANGQTVTCALNTVAVGETVSFDLAVQVPADLSEGSELFNTAIVRSDEIELDPSDNTASASTTVGAESDLRLAKLDEPDPVVAGSTLTYTLLISNEGPSNASGLRLTDPRIRRLFAAQTLTYPTNICVIDRGQDLLCNIPSLAAGDAYTITVTGRVEPSAAHDSRIDNTASVTASQPDPDMSNNSATSRTTVVRVHDLSVSKSGPASIVAGQRMSYQVAVTNAGPSNATNVRVTDILPSGATFVPGSSSGACVLQADGQTVICTIADMALGTQTFTVAVDVNPSLASGTVLINQATVSANANETEVDPSNNTSQLVQTTVSVQPDVGVSKTDNQSTVVAGDGITYSYTIIVTSRGPSTAKSVELADGWPTEFIRGTVTTNVGSCAASANNGFTCSLGDMLPGTSAVITADYTVPAGAPEGPQDNIATVDYLDAQLIASDNDVTTIETRADMSVLKSDDQDPIVAGDRLTHQYTITVTNGGPSNADGVVLSDTWPAGFVQGTISAPPDATCTPAGADFTCDLGTMAPNSTATVVVEFEVASDATVGLYNNAVSVTSEEVDPDTSNNSYTESTEVIAESDLGISKDDGQASVVAGTGGYVFAIDVTNAGPSLASGVVVTETWPAGYVISSTNPACSGTTGTFTCSLPDIPFGGTETLTIDYRVLPDAPGVVTNTVSVGSLAADPGPDPNTATDANTITRSADLSITKTDGQPTVTAGTGGTYTILVTNNGPSIADGVSVVDTWPADFDFVSASSSVGTCGSLAGNQITCNIGTLNVGATAIVTLQYEVDANHTPKADITNTASVSSAEPDPNSGNNTDTDLTSIVTSVDVAIQKTATPQTVNAGGGPYAYTINLTNNGPSVAHNVIVTDTWPSALSAPTPTSPNGTCSVLPGGDFVCDLGTIPDGQTATINVQYSVPANTPGGTITNTVTAASDDPDRLPGNDNASATTTILSAPDLTITKEDFTDTVVLGETYTFTIAVDNIGQTDAANVIVTDNWPISYTLVTSSTTAGAGCGPLTGGVITCGLGIIPGGASETITLQYRLVNSAADGITVTNTATVSTTTVGDPTGNNSDDDANLTVTIFSTSPVLAPYADEPVVELTAVRSWWPLPDTS